MRSKVRTKGIAVEWDTQGASKQYAETLAKFCRCQDGEISGHKQSRVKAE